MWLLWDFKVVAIASHAFAKAWLLVLFGCYDVVASVLFGCYYFLRSGLNASNSPLCCVPYIGFLCNVTIIIPNFPPK